MANTQSTLIPPPHYLKVNLILFIFLFNKVILIYRTGERSRSTSYTWRLSIYHYKIQNINNFIDSVRYLILHQDLKSLQSLVALFLLLKILLKSYMVFSFTLRYLFSILIVVFILIIFFTLGGLDP